MYKQLVTELDTLLSMPDVYLRLREILNNPSVDGESLLPIIGFDPGLSARLLQLVNSPIYGFSTKIGSLHEAIKIIGIHELENLILATKACDIFAQIPSGQVDMSCFWHHSVYVAITANLLAIRCSLPDPERLFAVGLLHDIGQLLIFKQHPELASRALAQAKPTDDGLYHAEKEVLGFTHGDLGAELFHTWKLPALFVEVAALHHEPGLSKNFTLETAIVNLANSLVNTLEPVRNITECSVNYDPEVLRIVGIPAQELDTILNEAETLFTEVINIISPDAPLL